MAATSFYTGKNPAKTTVFNYFKDDGSFLTSNDVKGPAVWSILDKYGYTSSVIDVPMTYPPEKINGFMISNPILEGCDDFTVPGSLIKNKNIKNFDSHMNKIVNLCKNPDTNEKEIYKEFLKEVDLKFRIFVKNLKSEKYDFSILWLGVTDLLQHFFWKRKDILLEAYSEIDKKIKKILEEFSGVNIIIFSDHGFVKSEDYYFHVNDWLRENGYLKFKWSRPKLFFFYKIYYLVDRYLPKKWRNRIVKPLVKNVKEESAWEVQDSAETEITKLASIWRNLKGIEWENTAAFMDQLWGIRIIKNKLRVDYEYAREDIIKKLAGLEHENKKIIENVWKREEIFKGIALKELPDIIFLINNRYEPTGIILSRTFTKRRNKVKYKTGNHYPTNGIFIAYGPDFKKGMRIEKVSLLDIVPTVLYFFQVNVPRDMDGKILKQIFKKISLKSRKKIKTKWKIKKSERVFTKKQEEELKERLRALGYI